MPVSFLNSASSKILRTAALQRSQTMLRMMNSFPSMSQSSGLNGKAI